MAKSLISVPVEIVENSILLIRGQKVMLDRDLARLYGVDAKVLNQAVKRNLDRFPEDFMFQLTLEETRAWSKEIVNARSRSQNVTLKARRGYNIKYQPYAVPQSRPTLRQPAQRSAFCGAPEEGRPTAVSSVTPRRSHFTAPAVGSFV